MPSLSKEAKLKMERREKRRRERAAYKAWQARRQALISEMRTASGGTGSQLGGPSRSVLGSVLEEGDSMAESGIGGGTTAGGGGDASSVLSGGTRGGVEEMLAEAPSGLRDPDAGSLGRPQGYVGGSGAPPVALPASQGSASVGAGALHSGAQTPPLGPVGPAAGRAGA